MGSFTLCICSVFCFSWYWQHVYAVSTKRNKNYPLLICGFLSVFYSYDKHGIPNLISLRKKVLSMLGSYVKIVKFFFSSTYEDVISVTCFLVYDQARYLQRKQGTYWFYFFLGTKTTRISSVPFFLLCCAVLFLNNYSVLGNVQGNK